MKKILLFAFLALMSISASAAQWFISGAFQGWSHCNANYELKETATAGVYQLDFSPAKSMSGEFLICQGKVGSPDWNNKIGITSSKKIGLDSEYKYTKNAGNFMVDGAIEVSAIILDTNNGTLLLKGESVANEYTNVFIVGDINGSGWNDSMTTYPMTLKEGTEDTWTTTLKVKSNSYLKFRAGFNLYGNGLEYPNDTIIIPGTEYTTELSGQSYVLNQPGEYIVTYVLPFDAPNGKLTIDFKPIIPETLYIIGNVNGGDWSPVNGIAMTKDVDQPSVFFASNVQIGESLGSGFGYFSFATNLGADESDWNSIAPRYGALENDFVPTLGENVAFTNGENAFKVNANKAYIIYVNFSDMTINVTEVIDKEDIFSFTPSADLTGSIKFVPETTNESAYFEAEFTTKDLSVPVTINIPEGYTDAYCGEVVNPGYFSKKATWVPEDQAMAAMKQYGCELTKTNVLNIPTDNNSHLYFVFFGKDGNMNMEIDNALRLEATASFPVSVETIEAAGEAVYFNLQGVKVANPENGIFVKVVNGKATKVTL